MNNITLGEHRGNPSSELDPQVADFILIGSRNAIASMLNDPPFDAVLVWRTGILIASVKAMNL